MPIVIFSYDKPVEAVAAAGISGPIELTTVLDFIPGPRNWTLINFTWHTFTDNSVAAADLFDDLASSCKLFPTFLMGQSHVQMGETRVDTTAGYPSVTTTAGIPFIRKNGFPFQLISGFNKTYAGMFDQQSFNPVPFGVVDITNPVLKISFQGDCINVGLTTPGAPASDRTKNVIKFDAIFHYD